MNKSETQKYACELREEIARLEENVGYYKDSLSRTEKNCNKLHHENKELKQRIAELEKENLRLTESVLRKETKIHELESKEVEKPTKYITVIVAKEINGQEYVRLEDFVSVVNDLQAKIGT